MKSITFYSYKGGVGRSLALSKIARMLSELGQKVFIIDFDLDAPGLQFKFTDYEFQPIKKGFVDYIYEFSEKNTIGDIIEYTVVAESQNDYSEDIMFMPAGDIHSDNYWRKLAKIRWYDLFYGNDALGIDFFLDLKAQIETKFQPDFLLIDSRTGITDISGVTLKLLADQVVVLGINNKENLFGCKKIIGSLINTQNNLLGQIPKIDFVLTRVSLFKKSKQGDKEVEVVDFEKEFLLLNKLRNDFQKSLGMESLDISVIHSDRRLEQEEVQLWGSSYSDTIGSVSQDYENLFDTITKDYLKLDQKAINSRKAMVEFGKAIKEPSYSKQIELITKAIELDEGREEFFVQRGLIKYRMGDFEGALADTLSALKLSPNNIGIYYNLGQINFALVRYEEAIKNFEKASNFSYRALTYRGDIYRKTNRLNEALAIYNEALETYTSIAEIYNARADTNRVLKRFNEAIEDISRAIQLDSNEALYFATLAEIYADMGKDDEFFLNLGIALSKGLDGHFLNFAYDVYKRYFENERFTSLMNKYSIDINEIMDESLFPGYL